MSVKRTREQDDSNVSDVKRCKLESKDPLFYAHLIDSLDKQLPAVLIRVVLSFCDAVSLSLTDVDLPTVDFDMERDLLPALSGRYETLSPTHYADDNFMDKLCIGMRLDVKRDPQSWRVGTIINIAERHEDHIYEHADPRYQECQSRCGDEDCLFGPAGQTGGKCLLMKYDTPSDESFPDIREWISTRSCCLACGKSVPSRLEPFLSVWDDEDERDSLDWYNYIRPGIIYSRPYLDKYSIQMADNVEDQKEESACLYVRDVTTALVVREHKLHGCLTDRFGTVAAMTCDDNGRVYALVRPYNHLIVITLQSLPALSLMTYSLRDILPPEEPIKTDEHGYEISMLPSFLLFIHDASMVLYIQELECTSDGPTPVRTRAVALPLLPAIPPVFA